MVAEDEVLPDGADRLVVGAEVICLPNSMPPTG